MNSNGNKIMKPMDLFLHPIFKIGYSANAFVKSL